MGRRLTPRERREREQEKRERAAASRQRTQQRRANERAVKEKQRATQKNLKDSEKAKQIKTWEKEVDIFSKFIDSFSNLHNFSKIKSSFSFKTYSRRINFNPELDSNTKVPSKKEIEFSNVKEPKQFSFKPSPELDVLRKKSNYNLEEYCSETDTSSFFLFVLILGTRKKYDEYIANAKEKLNALEKDDLEREKEEKESYQKYVEEYETDLKANENEYEKAVKLAEEAYQVAVNTYKEDLATQKNEFDVVEEKRLQFVKDILSGTKEQIGIACELVWPLVFKLDEDWLNSDPDDLMVGYRVINSSNFELVISLPKDIDFLPQHGIKMTSSGQSQTEYKISDRDRINITDNFISSIAFAYACVIYKIAPTINTIKVEVSKLGTDPATGKDKDYNYISIEFKRDKFASLNLSKIEPVDALGNFEHKLRSIKNEKKIIDLSINRDNLEWSTADDSNIEIDKHLQTVFISYFNQDKDINSRLKDGESVDISIENPTSSLKQVNKTSIQEDPNSDLIQDEIKPDVEDINVSEKTVVETKSVNGHKDNIVKEPVNYSDDNLIGEITKNLILKYSDITIKQTKTAGTSIYLDGRKLLQISDSTKNRIEILILRDSKQNYYRPHYAGIDIRNIRKYDPSQASYIKPWGYMFYRVLLTREEFVQNSDVIYNLIDSSYHTANNDDILKVEKTNHEILDPIFNNTYDVMINQ